MKRPQIRNGPLKSVHRGNGLYEVSRFVWGKAPLSRINFNKPRHISGWSRILHLTRNCSFRSRPLRTPVDDCQSERSMKWQTFVTITWITLLGRSLDTKTSNAENRFFILFLLPLVCRTPLNF